MLPFIGNLAAIPHVFLSTYNTSCQRSLASTGSESSGSAFPTHSLTTHLPAICSPALRQKASSESRLAFGAPIAAQVPGRARGAIEGAAVLEHRL